MIETPADVYAAAYATAKARREEIGHAGPVDPSPEFTAQLILHGAGNAGVPEDDFDRLVEAAGELHPTTYREFLNLVESQVHRSLHQDIGNTLRGG